MNVEMENMKHEMEELRKKMELMGRVETTTKNNSTK